MNNKTIDLRMNLYKEDLANSINELNVKYDMPLCLSDYLISEILTEVKRLSSIELNKHIEEYKIEKEKECEK